MGGSAGVIDLTHVVGGDNAAAYLGTIIVVEGDQQAMLEIGSDDGVKVWLNDQVIHTNNASRGVTPGQDKIAVNLVDGRNTLMLKVTNGSGGWGACARLTDKNGKAHQIGKPRVNMCAPPEQWQAYDIDFSGAKRVNGQQIPAVVTVVHNGITIHNQLTINRATGGALDANLLQPGGIYLQDHSNPVQYRNIWILPK